MISYKQLIIIGFVLVMVLFTGCMSEKHIVVTEKLISLDRNDNTIHGNFRLGSGTIEGEPYYIYYVQTDDNGYKLVSVNSNFCTVYKDEDNNPFVVAGYVKDNTYTSQSYSEGHVGDQFIFRKYGNDTLFDPYFLNSEVEIHIPRNSTIGGYNP